MAHIQDRWYKTIHHPDGTTERVKTSLYGKGMRYKLRWIGADGKEDSESFPDKKNPANPFAARSIRAPIAPQAKVVPWSAAVRANFRSGINDRYRIAADLGAGCGLRQGEIFAVSPDDIDPERPILHVVRQIRY